LSASRPTRCFTRTIILALATPLCAVLMLGCGPGSDDTGHRGKVQTFAQPVTTPQGHVPADDKESETAQSRALKTPAGRARATRQIKKVVNRFLAAAARHDTRAMCSLFGTRGLGRTGGTPGCRRFYDRALTPQSKFPPNQNPKVIFVKGGTLAEVTYSGQRLFEVAPAGAGQWVIERSPGF
jgi:hypothetical protein